MAEENENQPTDQAAAVAAMQDAAPPKKHDKGGGPSKLLVWAAVALAVVAVASGAGFGLGRMLASAQAAQPEKTETDLQPNINNQEFSYIDFETITVNLDEPRLGRYVRVILTLSIAKGDERVAGGMIEKQKRELKNWLTVYFAGCSLDQIRGAKNVNRIRREILDAFNNQLTPDARPLIHDVLLKEFAVQ